MNETEDFKPGRGADADPCSTWYPGHRAFEAPEVNNIANYIMQLPNIHAFIDLRSYGQMRALAYVLCLVGLLTAVVDIVSLPYSYSCDVLPADAEDLYEAALGAAYAIRRKHGIAYTVRHSHVLPFAPSSILTPHANDDV